MGERCVTFKGSEKRPKNWVKTHRASHIKGMRLVCKNNRRYLERTVKWDFERYPNPDFKWSNVVVIDTTKVHNAVWNVSCTRGLVGKRAIRRQTQEKRISGGSAFNGIWAGDADVNPGYYSCLELDFPKCKFVKKNPDSSICSYHGTPKAGPERTCGTSGTSETHEYHLERIVKKMLVERGFPEIGEDDEYPDQPLGYFIVQMDKFTCQSYNNAQNFFLYNGVPTKRTVLLLEEISAMHGVFVMAVVQPSHCFDINGCDALLHSAQKRKMRTYPAPLCTAHIVRDWNRACEEVCHHRLIQRCFMRALRRDENGDIDEDLIPESIRDWYDDGDDEQDSLSEYET